MRNTWLKLAGLGLLAAALIFHMTRPIPTHAVVVDSSPEGIAKANQAARAWVPIQIVATLELILLVSVIWFAWRLYTKRPK